MKKFEPSVLEFIFVSAEDVIATSSSKPADPPEDDPYEGTYNPGGWI